MESKQLLLTSLPDDLRTVRSLVSESRGPHADLSDIDAFARDVTDVATRWSAVKRELERRSVPTRHLMLLSLCLCVFLPACCVHVCMCVPPCVLCVCPCGLLTFFVCSLSAFSCLRVHLLPAVCMFTN